jgi:type I restriction enzyme M protein
MARRHELRAGEWESAATRLDEIISAHSGEDPFDEALKLLVAKLAYEASGAASEPFLQEDEAPQETVDRWLADALSRWPGVLGGAQRTRLHAAELRRCGAVLAQCSLLDGELVGLDAIFEYIVGKAAKGQKGQFFTPRFVIHEVVQMLEPRAGERVVDPACGSGGFLRHAARLAPEADVWGFDQDARAVLVAQVMLAASGREARQVIRADSLRRPSEAAAPVIEHLVRERAPAFDGFDVVLTNPPFAGDVGREYSAQYELAGRGRAERDVLFVERCLELLRPGGRFAIVLPFNKVGGEAYAHVREWLLQRAQVLAVVGLGRNTFQPHTSQKACVVIGQKRAALSTAFQDERITFFVSERDGKDARGRLRLDADGRSLHDLAEATPRVRERLLELRNQSERAWA